MGKKNENPSIKEENKSLTDETELWRMKRDERRQQEAAGKNLDQSNDEESIDNQTIQLKSPENISATDIRIGGLEG